MGGHTINKEIVVKLVITLNCDPQTEMFGAGDMYYPYFGTAIAQILAEFALAISNKPQQFIRGYVEGGHPLYDVEENIIGNVVVEEDVPPECLCGKDGA
jgi:hypothetical protein